MKNFKILLTFIISFFVGILCTNAYAPLCSYTGIHDETNQNEWVYVIADGSRTMIWTPDKAPLEGMENALTEYMAKLPDNSLTRSIITFTDGVGMTNVSAHDVIAGTYGTTYFFNGSYSYLYISLFMNGHRDKVNNFGFNPSYVPQAETDQFKKSFVLAGECPKYICLCKTNTNQSGFFTYEYAHNNDLGEGAITTCESQGCSVSELAFELFDNKMFHLNLYKDEILKASTDQISTLTSDEIDKLANLFNLVLPCNNEETKCMNNADLHRVASMLIYQTDDSGQTIPIERAYKNILKNKDLKFSDPEAQSKYQDLLTAADFFRRAVSTGAGSLIDIYNTEKDCKNIIGDVNVKGSFAYYLQSLFSFIQYLGPVLVIILTVAEYFKAIFDDSTVKKANKNTITRLILLVLLFFIPLLLKIIMQLLGVTSNCGIK